MFFDDVPLKGYVASLSYFKILRQQLKKKKHFGKPSD